MQQFNTLSKLQCLANGDEVLLLTLSWGERDRLMEDHVQHYIWQSPMMLLNISVFLFVIGLLQLVYVCPVRKDKAESDDGRTVSVLVGIRGADVANIHLLRSLSSSL
jgi:hypothetical protein